MDFSHAGYKGGGVILPVVNVVDTLGPEAFLGRVENRAAAGSTRRRR
jgi:hypothetical protein